MGRKGTPATATRVTLKQTYLHISALILLGVILYANTFSNGFVYDDHSLIENSPTLKSSASVLRAFTTDFWQFSQPYQAIGYYRPLVVVSYIIDYHIWKTNPFGYHLTNLLFHLLTSVMVYFTILKITKKKLAFVAALLFVAHPLHTESVAWISGRTDLIAAFFFTSSLYLYICYQETCQKKYLAGSLAVFACALLSKEITLILPFTLVLYDYCFSQDRFSLKSPFVQKITALIGLLKKNLLLYLLYGGIVAVYLAIRSRMVGSLAKVATLSSPYSLFYGYSYRTVLLNLPQILFFYLRQLLLPLQLNIDYVISFPTSFFELPVLLSWVGCMILIYLGLYFLKRSRRLFFAFGLFIILYLPVSNIIPLRTTIGERFMYLPSFALCLLLPAGIVYCMRKLSRKKHHIRLKKYLLVALVLYLLFFFVTTIRRNMDYRDDRTLWDATVRASPLNYRAQNNLGVVYSRQGEDELALAHFLRARELNPAFPEPYNNIGIIQERQGNYSAAQESYQKSLSLDFRQVNTHNNLGTLYIKTGNLDAAEQEFLSAITLSPSFSVSYNNLGSLYALKNDYPRALEAHFKAVSRNPFFARAWFNLGLDYRMLNRTQDAITAYRAAIGLDASYVSPLVNLGSLYLSENRTGDAIALFSRAHDLDKENPEILFNLGFAYLKREDYQTALSFFEKAAKYDPHSEKIAYFISRTRELTES